MVRVRHRHRQRVGRIIALRIGARQQHADHHADLRLVAVTGKLQSEQGVIHIVAERMNDLPSMLGLLSETGQTISALVPTDKRADLGKGACYNDVGVEVAAA